MIQHSYSGIALFGANLNGKSETIKPNRFNCDLDIGNIDTQII